VKPAFHLSLILACALSACADQPPPLDPPLPGSELDVHGCTPSAGYTWCQRTERCEQPWRLAAHEWFPSTREAYEGYCGNATR
jgi:hypothetical protein